LLKRKVTDFSLSQWLVIDGDSVLGLLNCVEVGDVASISDVHATYNLRIKVCAG
jgi:hypothetical protein